MGNIFMHLNGFSSIFVRAQTLHIVWILLRHKMPGKYSVWKGTSKYKRKKLAVLCASNKLTGTTPLNSPPVFLSPFSSWMKKLNLWRTPKSRFLVSEKRSPTPRMKNWTCKPTRSPSWVLTHLYETSHPLRLFPLVLPSTRNTKKQTHIHTPMFVCLFGFIIKNSHFCDVDELVIIIHKKI
jgi:hypothetical protein